MVFRLNASYHFKRGKGPNGEQVLRPSRLRGDLVFLYRMDPGFKGDGRVRHYRWDTNEPSGRCCASADEALQKTIAAYSNAICGHALPTATLSRWTHVSVFLS